MLINGLFRKRESIAKKEKLTKNTKIFISVFFGVNLGNFYRPRPLDLHRIDGYILISSHYKSDKAKRKNPFQ